MKARKLIWIGTAIALLVVPPVLNWILRSPAPFDTPVVGQPTDWLTFWGAYLGGILASIISFIVLYSTTKQNHGSLMIQIKEKSIREIENKITSCIEQFDFPQLYQISLKSLSHISEQEIQREIDRMNSLYSKVSTYADIWGICHDHETSNEAKDFNQKYCECLEGFKSSIVEMTRFLIGQRDAVQKGKPFDVPEMNEKIEKYKRNPSYYTNMYYSACRWLQSEREQLKELINNHKGLFNL